LRSRRKTGEKKSKNTRDAKKRRSLGTGPTRQSSNPWVDQTVHSSCTQQGALKSELKLLPFVARERRKELKQKLDPPERKER